ncbi:MAG: hypothetical protein EBZ67_15265, partial [Chitinophagia bacterium]|nr:hypothetical protein [Chitinophagia bacterium]
MSFSKCWLAVTALSLTLSTSLFSQRVVLPNGWSLTPAGKSFPLGDLPLNMAVSRSGRYIAVTNNGQSVQQLQMVDVKQQRVIDSQVLAKSWYGLKFSSDDRQLYVSGGHDNRILRFSVNEGRLKALDTFVLDKPWPVRVGPAGIELDEKRRRLYVVTREDRMLYVLDLDTKKVTARYGLDAEAYDCKLLADGQELFITCWGCNKLLRFDLVAGRWKTPVTVGDHPNEMLLAPGGRLLYVCNANDNSVSVVEVSSGRVIETLDAALYP